MSREFVLRRYGWGGLRVPVGLAGDTGTPSVPPVPIARAAARMQTRRVALLGDGGDFGGLSLGLARHRCCRGEEEGEGG